MLRAAPRHGAAALQRRATPRMRPAARRALATRAETGTYLQELRIKARPRARRAPPRPQNSAAPPLQRAPSRRALAPPSRALRAFPRAAEPPGTTRSAQNFALVDEQVVQFGPGLNIVTGASGSGKSLLVRRARVAPRRARRAACHAGAPAAGRTAAGAPRVAAAAAGGPNAAPF